jgi:hypothetical protein
VILHEIHVHGILVVKLEGDAPRPVDVNRVPYGLKTPKRMKIETGEIHLFRLLGNIEAIQPQENALVQPTIDPSGFSGSE